MLATKSDNSSGFTIRGIRIKLLLVMAYFIGITIIYMLGVYIQSHRLDSVWSWLWFSISIYCSLTLLGTIMNQAICYLRVDTYSLTVLHPLAKANTKDAMNQYILPCRRTFAFSEITEVVVFFVPWNEAGLLAMEIRLKDQSKKVLRIGAYRNKDINRLVDWLTDHGVKVDDQAADQSS